MDYFNEYTKNFDLSEYKASYKYYHSIRVMDDMEIIARNMSLPNYDVELAKCIGLLHDIGRFEQYARFKSYDDSNLDHGDFGEELLRKNNVLKNYDINESDYEVVYKAVRNHNKFEIEDGLTERELFFAKMIRDADKFDILYAFGNKETRKIFEDDDSEISEDVKEAFFKNEVIKRNSHITLSDEKIMLFAFAYDINLNVTKEMIKSQELYHKLYDRLDNKTKYQPYIEHIERYINERDD